MARVEWEGGASNVRRKMFDDDGDDYYEMRRGLRPERGRRRCPESPWFEIVPSVMSTITKKGNSSRRFLSRWRNIGLEFIFAEVSNPQTLLVCPPRREQKRFFAGYIVARRTPLALAICPLLLSSLSCWRVPNKPAVSTKMYGTCTAQNTLTVFSWAEIKRPLWVTFLLPFSIGKSIASFPVPRAAFVGFTL